MFSFKCVAINVFQLSMSHWPEFDSRRKSPARWHVTVPATQGAESSVGTRQFHALFGGSHGTSGASDTIKYTMTHDINTYVYQLSINVH